jgi:hypothetical protein
MFSDVLAGHLAELHGDAELIWIDEERKGKASGDGYNHRGEEEDERAGKAAAARHNLPELILTAWQQIFKVITPWRASTSPLPRPPPSPHGMGSSSGGSSYGHRGVPSYSARAFALGG